jgi:hypothetical protein
LEDGLGVNAREEVFHNALKGLGSESNQTLMRGMVSMLGMTCERQYPEVGYEFEGYSCSAHNMPWEECPYRSIEEI